MVTYFYKANKKVNLTPEKREAICNKIVGDFRGFYKDLDCAKRDTLMLLAELFPGLYKKDENLISKIPDIYEQYKTYTAAIHRACTASYDGMLDIEGQDERSNDMAGIYKASLVYDFNDINLMRELDDVVDDWTIKGEAALFINWKNEIIEVTVDEPEIYIDVDNGFEAVRMVKTKKQIPTFSGVNVKRIDPHNLYFDKTQTRNWDTCRKIYRDFVPIEDILANESYELTSAEKKELLELVDEKEDIGDLYAKTIDEETRVIGRTVEVLEFDGNFMLPCETEIIRRVEAVVIAGKYLAVFKESTKPCSPIIYDCYMARPDTGRGQSPLKVAYFLNQLENMCADLQLKSWQLNVVPTMLAPKGSLVINNKLKPGSPIEYDPAVIGGNIPEKLDFSSGLRGFDFADYFKTKIEGATGITQYLQGSQDGSVRTASEASFINSGATMRMALESHLFNNRIILPLMRTYAIFKKVYDNQDKQVLMPDRTFAKVDAEVRNGNYRFIIGGAQSTVEREAETSKLFELLSAPAFQSLIQQINPEVIQKFFIWVLNRMNFKETSQIVEMLGIQQTIESTGRALGVPEQDIPEMTQQVQQQVQQQIPETMLDLYTQFNQGGF